MSGNHVVLSGKVVAIDAMRYTPAGIPVLNLSLGHRSGQLEAGIEREVECEVPVVAMGDQAQQAARCKVGDGVKVQGFLARKSRNSSYLVLHANRIEIIEI